MHLVSFLQTSLQKDTFRESFIRWIVLKLTSFRFRNSHFFFFWIIQYMYIQQYLGEKKFKYDFPHGGEQAI